MASAFPTNLDALTDGSAGQPLSNPAHLTIHNDANDAIEKMQVKMGVDSSAVATSLDYKVSNAASSDPGHKHTAAAFTFTGASAYLSADSDNFAGGGAGWYKVALNAEYFDVGSNFNTGTYGFLVPTTGYYSCHGIVCFETADISVITVYGAAIYVDPVGAGAVALKQFGTMQFTDDAAKANNIEVNCVIYCTAGDLIHLYAYSDDTNVDIDGGATFTKLDVVFLGV